MLLQLQGTLSVACLQSVYEDDACVHIVMELCHGGPILALTHSRRFNEERVSCSFVMGSIYTG